MIDISFYEAEAKLRKDNEWDKWLEEIPFIKWPRNWMVKGVPPFAGAVIRYRVKLEGMQDEVSIYLDCYDRLGFYRAPYWEVYPYNDDIFRCGINEIDVLLKAIKQSLMEITRIKKSQVNTPTEDR